MVFFIVIIFICLFILFNSFSNLKKESQFLKSILEKYRTEIDTLKKENDEIKKSIEGKLKPNEESITPVEEIKLPETEVIDEPIQEIEVEEYTPYFTPIEEPIIEENSTLVEEIIIENTPIEEPILHYDAQSSPKLVTPIEEKIPEESAFFILFKKIEKQFADNWTGILGTAIMVLGIGYLSIYTALKVEPLFRVLILWLYSGLLIGSYYLLNKKEKWEKTGLWLRSAGASLFLFGCFGASQIDALSFITNDAMSYALIGLGISLNLYIGYIIKSQTFLSLHTILSILILCVIPEKLLITFVLAAITSTIGIILSYKEKWEYHLLIVIIGFILFDIWFNFEGSHLSKTENIIAILGIILVAASCIFMQYRSIYENTRFDKAAFITHLTNWILFAIGLILHSTGSKFKTFVLFIGAIICFFIALKARKKKIFWLYHLDGMVSFVLFSLSIIMLNDWNIGADAIACILYLFTVVCLFVVYNQNETLLHKIFLRINHVLAIGLVFFAALLISNSIEKSAVSNVLLSLSAITIISLLVPILSAMKVKNEGVDDFFGEKNLSLNGLLSITISLFVFLEWNNSFGSSFFYGLIFIGLIWCFLKKKFASSTFDIGRIIFLIATIVIGLTLIKIQEKLISDWLFALGFATIIVFNWTEKQFYKNDFIIRFISIIGFNALLLLLSFKYLYDYEIAHIVSLILIALLNHEFLWFNFKRKSLIEENQTLLYIVYYFFIIASSLLFLYHSFEFNSTQIALTCLAISAIEAYVLFAKHIKNKSDETIVGWTNFNLLNSEFLLFNFLVLGFSCIQENYLSIYLSVLSVLCFVAFLKFSEFKRYNIYSFIILILSIVLSILGAVENFDSKSKTILYITQATTFLISLSYNYLQFKSEKENAKNFIIILPYLQNLWVVALVFIQVDISYLPLLFILLAMLNLWLIDTEKIKIPFRFVLIIACLAIVVSVFYSFDKLNNFNLIDWILQLSSIGFGLFLTLLLNKKETIDFIKSNYQIVLNIWLSLLMFSQLEHKWLPVYWSVLAILNLYLYFKKISQEKNINIIYYLLANLHLGFLSFNYYESKFLAVYLLIFMLLAIYIYLASKWMEDFKLKNSVLIYPATVSIGLFLFLTFDKGILTFFWILEALGLLILGIVLKEKYFRYVSLSLVGICVIRLMFFDLSNTDFLIRALVLVGVGVVLIIMNSLFKKYKDRFD